MLRWVLGSVTIGVLCGWLLADEPKAADLAKKPQWQRMLSGDDAKTAEKLKKQIAELQATDDYAEAIKLAEELLALRTKVQGADHHETSTEKYYLQTDRTVAKLDANERRTWRVTTGKLSEAQQLESQARYAQALPIRKEMLEICRKVLGENHPDTANSYNNVAYNLEAQGKAAEAGPLFQKALDIRRKILGEDHPDTATSYNNVAANLDAQGKAAEAGPLHQKALDIRRKALGEDHPATAGSYNNVAANLQAQGKAAEAGPLFQKALDINRKIHGEDHPDTATSYNNVAMNLQAQGKAAEAGPLFQKALDIRRKALGEDHPDTATSYNNVAMNLYAQGKAAEAGPLFQKALDIRRKALGEDHPATALSYNNMAANLDAQGKAAEAGPLYQKALDICRKVLGEDHPATASCYNNLAYNLQAQGKAAEAGPLYQKALDIRRKVLGEDHPDTATSYNNVAINLQAQGKAAEAGPLYQKALNIRRKVLGEDHPDTATSYNGVAYNLQDQGKAAEAGPLYQKALDIRRKALGEDHPATATSYNNVAGNLQDQGKAAEAGPLFQKALDIRRKALGEDHPNTATSYNNVAGNLQAQGKAAEAGPLYQKALDINRKVLGEDHPDTANSYNNVAGNLQAQGKAAEAIAMLIAGVASYESSRLAAATGLERSSLTAFNPRLLLASLQAPQEPRTAWMHLERSLARGLFDQQSSGTRLTPAEQQNQQAARQRIAAIQPQILNIVSRGSHTAIETQELQKLLDERRKHEEIVSRLAVADSERAVESDDRIQAALPSETAILYWVDVADNTGRVQEHFACVVRREGEPKWERLPGTGTDGKWTTADTALPGQLRNALANSAPAAEVESLAKRLHTQRIAPILPHLTGVKTLHVVGVNWMAGIPVEALTQDYRIDYVPSGSSLARLGQQPRVTGQHLFALGDPQFPAINTVAAVVNPLPPGGLLITQVVPTGAAAMAGLKPGDVLVSYADQELTSVDRLKELIATNDKAKTNAITIWREGEAKLNTKDVPPGKLGVVLDPEPAPQAIAARRKTNETLAKLSRGGEWNELPGTAAELAGLKTLFPQNTTLTRTEANPKKLEALRASGELAKYRYLHFATHGEANSVMAFQSSLILHGDDKSVARLTAREILEKWKLNAELVTLSACETAIGKSGGGDGPLGFAQAFLTAGARSVCLSLWKVDDAATALLMDRFYRNLLGKRDGLDKPMGKADALHEAKQWLRNLSSDDATQRLATISKGVSRGGGAKAIEIAIPKSADAKLEAAKKPFDHPKYWAAFILIGDPN